MNECCYSPCDNDGKLDDEAVTCGECGWSACSACAEGNNWDACNADGEALCDECRPEET